MSSLTLRAPAKINLFLEVLRKRPDGYHDIETLLQEIDLADKITLTETASAHITIQTDSSRIPADSTNLAYKAADLFKKYIREKKRGISISVEKRIPVAAGLGGGSSDAAAVLIGLNRLWKTELKNTDFFDIAEKIGMDVPFFIEGGLCIGTGRGENVTPVASFPELWFVLTVPGIKVSTEWAYRNLTSPLTSKLKTNKILLDSIRSADLDGIAQNLFNRLEDVTMRSYSEIGSLKNEILSLGAKGALMSGSGPAVFGIFPSQQEAFNIMDSLKHKEEVYVVRTNKAQRF